MKIALWVIGKTNEKYLKDGTDIYLKRLKHYCTFEYTEWKDVGHHSNPDEIIKKEGEMILLKLKNDDFLILLDENGKEYTSELFADYIEKLQLQSTKSVVFLVGGAFGHHDNIRSRANHTMSLSKMTFSHQMIRLFFAEQLYRAFTIIKNEKYHNP
ncbi:MAG: 23S rRNA (pseudouridine(1915)-N(3))-methyltransferase RlmH [Saprospiraceae bacterium]|nr:23S rRNA (pseudouridine(1915)-N(3))-methyltransferase RlmH [Saprospiraceae bacterium]